MKSVWERLAEMPAEKREAALYRRKGYKGKKIGSVRYEEWDMPEPKPVIIRDPELVAKIFGDD